ncbi:MAG: TrkA family potassium uptake protein [Chloroflexota bacterium]|nr:TrkA family potassium uptake protein [Chloroflexota bacterium]MDE2683738.1 TrkA family potassium uptake protein [Chloroflexota bacterium]
MANQVCVIGLGRFGAKLATTLFQSQHEVLAIDQDDLKVQAMLGRVTYAVEADATSETVLRDLGVADMDVAVVALGSQIQSSIITTMLLKTMGLPFVIARATDTRHAEILHRVGADKVIFPEEEAAIRAASLDLTPNSIDFIGITETDGIHKLRPPEHMRGRSLRDVGLGGDNPHRIMAMVIQRGHEYIMNPDEDELIGDGDILVVVGSHEQIARTFER